MNLPLPFPEVLDGLRDFGFYITDGNRNVLYWSKGAEKILGYKVDELVGKKCFENPLNHVNRYGKELCRSKHCPLVQTIKSGKVQAMSVFLFAKHKNGHRVPVSVTVSPIKDHAGKVVGGLEVFHSAETEYRDLKMAQIVQQTFMPNPDTIPAEWPIGFGWVPAELIGGDFIQVLPWGEDQVMGLIIDISGHGVASALISGIIWKAIPEIPKSLSSPSKILRELANLYGKAQVSAHFFSAQCFIFSWKTQEIIISNAGHPSPLFLESNGEGKYFEMPGDLIGLYPDLVFEEKKFNIKKKRVVMYSDGLIETRNADENSDGEEWFKAQCRNFHSLPQKSFIEQIIKQSVEYSEMCEASDDISLLVIDGKEFS